MAKDARTAWKAAAKLLERRWDRASYEAWLRPTTYLRCENDTFVIGVPDSYVFDMLAHRLHNDVKEALRETTGRAAEIEFRVQQGRVAPHDSEAEMPLFKLMAQRASAAAPEPREPIERANGAEPPDSAINPRMVFERFIVNDSNHLATEAARAVAEHPATVYNPFLVYGGVGIGKTHLLHAIAN